MNPDEYGELADDISAVTDIEPATGGFGPVLYGVVDQDEAEGFDGYLRPADDDVAAMRDDEARPLGEQT